MESSDSALAQVGAELGGVVGTQQLENLPLNGRSWADLIALVPGAVDTGAATASSIRFVGHANDDNNFQSRLKPSPLGDGFSKRAAD